MASWRSVGPPNVSFVPRDRLITSAPRSAAQRIAWDVLKDEPSPLEPRARIAITLTWAAPAIARLLSVRAAIPPPTPVPWNVPPATSSSIGFESPAMKSYPCVPSVLDHMFGWMSLWVHQTPVSTRATPPRLAEVSDKPERNGGSLQADLDEGTMRISSAIPLKFHRSVVNCRTTAMLGNPFCAGMPWDAHVTFRCPRCPRDGSVLRDWTGRRASPGILRLPRRRDGPVAGIGGVRPRGRSDRGRPPRYRG